MEDTYFWYVDIECIFCFNIAGEVKKKEGVGMIEHNVEVCVKVFDGFGCRFFDFGGHGDKMSYSIGVEVILFDNINNFASVPHDNYIMSTKDVLLYIFSIKYHR